MYVILLLKVVPGTMYDFCLHDAWTEKIDPMGACGPHSDNEDAEEVAAEE